MPGHVVLPGSARSLLPSSEIAGVADPSQMVSITVKVRSRGDLSALEKEVYKQAQRPLAKRKYLSASDIEERYGASGEDLDAVEQVAARHDLLVSRRSPAERTVIL